MESDKMNPAEKKDIFDKIMSLPIFNIFEPIYKKYKEGLLYLFFGGLSFSISIGTYALFTEVFGINVLIGNAFAWIFSVSFAYTTNRIWVFGTEVSSVGGIIKEIGKFVSGRIATLVIEELILLVFITWLHFNSMAVKITAEIVVIVLNYFISKLWVFDK